MKTTQYFLRTHAFFCTTDHFCFILNVKADKYLCVEMRQFSLMAPHLYGFSIGDLTDVLPLTSMSPEAARLADALVSEGILSNLPADTKEARHTVWQPPSRELRSPRHRGSALRRLAYGIGFLRAAIRTHWQLNQRSFDSIIFSVTKRKQNHGPGGHKVDEESIARLARSFDSLRLSFPRNYVCLFDSLALIEFLSQYHIFPTWVFGIRPEPFLAHCWVQLGDTVLNDTVEHASAFIPIMAV